MPDLTNLLQFTLVRSEKAAQHLTTFVVAAITTILLTRLFLALSGYPQIGGDSGLHIAHVLPGGLLMLAGLVLGFAYVGPGPRPLAALLGGVGFGLFIDEVGKFVTSDNDYFFEPAAAIMYVVFMGLVVGAQAWRNHRPLTDAELVANAAHVLTDGLAGRLSSSRQAEVLHTLDRLGDAKGAKELHGLLANIECRTPAAPQRVEELWQWTRRAFERLAQRKFAGQTIGALLLLQAAGAVLAMLFIYRDGGGYWVSFGGVVIGTFGSTVFTVNGMWRWVRVGRQKAVEQLQRSVLISLLVTQVFLFSASQFAATAGLFVDLALLGLVTADLERRKHAATSKS